MQVKCLPTFASPPRMALAAGLTVLSAACAGPAPAPTATFAPTAASETAAVLPTTSPTQTVTPTLVPTTTPTATPPSRALRDLKPGEALSLFANIPVLRVDFGLRSTFSPRSPILYHTGVGPQIVGYDLQTGETVFRLGGFPRGAPQNLEVSPAGDLLIAEDGSALGVWDLPGGEPRARLQMPAMFTPMTSGFLGTEAVYAADFNGNVALWDAATWQERARLFIAGNVDAAFVLPSGEAVILLLRGESELKIVRWSGAVIRSIPLPASPWRFLAISPGGDRAMLHVDPGKGTEGILIISLEDPQDALSIPLLNIRELAVSDDWRTLAVTDVSEVLRLFDPQTGEAYHAQPLDAFQVMGLSLSADGSLLAVHVRSAGSTAGTIQVWGRELP